MLTVYIASPYSLGDKQENVQRQIDCAHLLLDLGHCPIWPLASHYLELSRARPYEQWLEMDFELIRRCDVLLRLDGESSGAIKEVEFARSIGKRVVFSVNELQEQSNG